jgi:hypothetical protein
METLGANFEVLQKILNFNIDVFVIREVQLTILGLKNINLKPSIQANNHKNGRGSPTGSLAL